MDMKLLNCGTSTERNHDMLSHADLGSQQLVLGDFDDFPRH